MPEANTTSEGDKKLEIKYQEEAHTVETDISAIENGDKSPTVKEKDTRFSNIDRKRLYRRVDMWVVPVTTILYLFSFIDRANIVSFVVILDWKDTERLTGKCKNRRIG
jgi:hypothetical protein